jgi:hypothetical protein
MSLEAVELSRSHWYHCESEFGCLFFLKKEHQEFFDHKWHQIRTFRNNDFMLYGFEDFPSGYIWSIFKGFDVILDRIVDEVCEIFLNNSQSIFESQLHTMCINEVRRSIRERSFFLSELRVYSDIIRLSFEYPNIDEFIWLPVVECVSGSISKVYFVPA